LAVRTVGAAAAAAAAASEGELVDIGSAIVTFGVQLYCDVQLVTAPPLST